MKPDPDDIPEPDRVPGAPHPRHTDRVIISVEDNGEGIPYSQQARIFEPFVQVGRKKGGAGLGLALCKEITRLHGGRIGIHSRVEHGTIVYMALPV